MNIFDFIVNLLSTLKNIFILTIQSLNDLVSTFGFLTVNINTIQWGFQDPATPIAEGIIDFHHDLIFLLFLISGIVFYALFEIILVNRSSINEIPSKTIEHQLLEIIWTVIPIIILMLIALPSYALLYSLEELKNPVLTTKVCGHQWYWTYEYNDKIKTNKELYFFYNEFLDQIQKQNNVKKTVLPEQNLTQISEDIINNLSLNLNKNIFDELNTLLYICERNVKRNNAAEKIEDMVFETVFDLIVKKLQLEIRVIKDNRFFTWNEIKALEAAEDWLHWATKYDAQKYNFEKTEHLLSNEESLTIAKWGNEVRIYQLNKVLETLSELKRTKINIIKDLFNTEIFDIIGYNNMMLCIHNIFFLRLIKDLQLENENLIFDFNTAEEIRDQIQLNLITNILDNIGKNISTPKIIDDLINTIQQTENNIMIMQLRTGDVQKLNEHLYAFLNYILEETINNNKIVENDKTEALVLQLKDLFFNIVKNYSNFISKNSNNNDNFNEFYNQVIASGDLMIENIDSLIKKKENILEQDLDIALEKSIKKVIPNSFNNNNTNKTINTIKTMYDFALIPLFNIFEYNKKGIKYDSYIVNEQNLIKGSYRMLETDMPLVFGIKQHIRLLITSSDVLHSFAVPALGIKMDACPGRLNQLEFFLRRKGRFYGQCSEICGINHSFMPITVIGINYEDFKQYITEFYNHKISKIKIYEKE